MRIISIPLAVVLLASLSFLSCQQKKKLPPQTVGEDPSVETYAYPEKQPRSAVYEMWVNGKKVDVLATSGSDFAAFGCSGPVEVEIKTTLPFKKVLVRPLVRGIESKVEGQSIRFTLNGPQNVFVELQWGRELFIYANPIETQKPSPTDPKVHFYKAGQIYEVGELNLESGETLYLEGGAVVRGCVRVKNASRVNILGHGILDGGFYHFKEGKRVQSIIFEHCEKVQVQGIIMIEPSAWMLVFGACRDVYVGNIKQIGLVVSSDGIDICGSRDVLVEDCILRNDDDNIAIKSLKRKDRLSWDGDVANVLVRRSVFYNGPPGNSMEVGFELRTASIKDVVFEDIDVIRSAGDGAVMSIHNGDRATVENIRWENIRVEHYWHNLIDLRVMKSQYSEDPERGQIRNVVFRNIRVLQTPPNDSYSTSVIGGWSADRPIKNVVFEEVWFNANKVKNADDLNLYTRNCEGLISARPAAFAQSSSTPAAFRIW